MALVEQRVPELVAGDMLTRDEFLTRWEAHPEIKKAELLQLMAQQPALGLVDEPDAGVDLDSIAVVGQALTCLVKQPSAEAVAPAALIITHTGHILNYLRADVGHVLYGGTLVGEGHFLSGDL